VRLFVAAEVPRPVLADLQERVQRLIGSLPEARWTGEATRHITLKFLGPTEPERLPEVQRRCTAVAAAGSPCDLRIEGLGAFPRPGRATVLWAGVGDSAGMLGRLAGGLDAAFSTMGYRAEARPFAAHVTLARFRRPARLGLPDLEPLEPFLLRGIHLYRSHLSAAGARYEPLAAFRLGEIHGVREEVGGAGG
jgi:2'-5' RNA ligase